MSKKNKTYVSPHKESPRVFWIDLFCGAGGVTTGIHLANANAKVIVCVNHDPEAIKCHKKNHPDCLHLTEDVTDFNVVLKIKKIVQELRRKYPDCIINIWASLECTHFSKAKGGLSRDADSRTLADHLYKYIEQLDPDYVYIENVREFLTWGPMEQETKEEKGKILFKCMKTVNGKTKTKAYWVDKPLKGNSKFYNKNKYSSWNVPIKSKKGIDYRRWRDAINFYGYNYEYKMLNSADFGAYTSRERYFGVFARIGLPISFPDQTHIKRSKLKDTGLKPWKAVREVLDLNSEGRTIFGLTKMNRPYSDNTMKRILAGLHKFQKEGLFIKKYYSGRPKGKVTSVNDPLGTVTTVNNQAIVQPVFIKRYNGGNPAHKVTSAADPLGTILTSRTHALVKPIFLTSYYGNGNSHSIDDPCNTLTTKERYAAHFINYDYSKATHSSLDNPAGAITNVPKHNLITAQWTFDTQFKNRGRSINEPAQTLIARMDKKPVYFVSANHRNEIDYTIDLPTDSKTVLAIKDFMRNHEMKDIKIRMLSVPELKSIQGFPDDFELTGTKTNQLKFIGNSVVPLMAQKLIESNYESLMIFKQAA